MDNENILENNKDTRVNMIRGEQDFLPLTGPALKLAIMTSGKTSSASASDTKHKYMLCQMYFCVVEFLYMYYHSQF